jgi:hypothetical protein
MEPDDAAGTADGDKNETVKRRSVWVCAKHEILPA